MPKTAPTMSSLPVASGAVTSFSRRRPTSHTTMATGALRKYNHRQLLNCRIDADALGATAAESGPAAAHAATAVERRVAGNSGSTMESDAGMTSAPAMACSTRAAINTHTLGANADSTDETANNITPSWNILTRPWRSAIRPPSGRNAAVPIKYPEETNAVVVSATAGNEAVMSSNAILVAVELNPTSTYPAAPIAKAFQASGAIATGSVVPSSLLVLFATNQTLASPVMCTKSIHGIRPSDGPCRFVHTPIHVVARSQVPGQLPDRTQDRGRA